MRRVASWTILAAVAVVAVFAVVDTVRRAVQPEPAQAEPRPRPIDGLTLLTGRLVWTDERCRLHVTALGTLREVVPPRRVRCEARLRRSGELGEDGAPSLRTRSPSGTLSADASGGRLVVVKDGRRVTFPIRGVRALAWSPDERWLAVAGRRNVYAIRMLNRDLRIRRRPIAATQIAWIRA
jgi:hypothetical protein